MELLSGLNIPRQGWKISQYKTRSYDWVGLIHIINVKLISTFRLMTKMDVRGNVIWTVLLWL